MTVIDGATNATATVSAGTNPYAVAVNPVTNKFYVANYNSNYVTVIDEVREWDTGLQATINYIPNHACYSNKPAIYGMAVIGWSPNTTHINMVLNNWLSGQNAWEQSLLGFSKTEISNWQYTWGSDSLLWGDNYINIVPLESQSATTNNLGLGTPMAGNMLTYPIYYMDNIVPSAAALISPANKTIVRDSQFTFAWNKSTDNYSVGRYQYQYAKDAGFSLGLFDTTISDTNLSRKLPTTDTLYYWRVRPVDAAGNIGSWSSVWSVEMDLAAPTTPGLAGPYDNNWFSDTLVVFTWTTVGKWAKGSAVRYVKQLDTINTFGSGFLKTDTTAFTMDTILLGEGQYYWRVMAYDLAGNVGSYSAYKTFGVDTTIPNIFDLKSPINLNTVTARPTLIWQPANDGLSGIQAYELYIDGALKHSGTDTSWIADSLADGNYTWYVKAVDLAGNDRLSDQTWSFTVNQSLGCGWEPAFIASGRLCSKRFLSQSVQRTDHL